MKSKYVILIITLFAFLTNCRKENKKDSSGGYAYNPKEYVFVKPIGFPDMPIPADNPMTYEGIELGKKLFFDKKLSGDNSISCASCHLPENSFTDPNQFSKGVDGALGDRQSMVLHNLAWSPTLFWDGRSSSLEEQALKPVTNPIEMHETWKNASAEIKQDIIYRSDFKRAFGNETIDSTTITKAIAQFIRSLVSSNSKFDMWTRGEITLTPEELNGFDIFRDLDRGDCIHCHAENGLFTDFSFHNNGMDLVFNDLGLGAVTGKSTDEGKFKVPSLRNLAFSAPYMHDGRFKTLDEVIDFYSEGVNPDSPNISPLMEHKDQGGALLTAQEKSDLKAFLLTLSDYDFINNPNHRAP